MPSFIDPSFGPAGHLRAVLWSTYLAAAVILPIYHVRPILRYVRGSNGIGDACVRTEAIQCLWRLPALLYSVFVAPSLPLFLSIALDLVGRIGRVLAMHASRRRWQAMQACRLPGPDSDLTGRGRVHGGTRPASHDQGPVMQTTIRTRTTPMDAAAAFLVRVAAATFSALREAPSGQPSRVCAAPRGVDAPRNGSTTPRCAISGWIAPSAPPTRRKAAPSWRPPAGGWPPLAAEENPMDRFSILAHLPVLAALVLAACGGGGNDGAPPGPASPQGGYVATALVDGPDAPARVPAARSTDPRLVDAWGIAIASTGDAWVASQAGASARHYDAAGGFVPVAVELEEGGAGTARPTGVVSKDSRNFTVSQAGRSGTCSVIAVGLSGTIDCWAPDVGAAGRAIRVVDGAAPGALYTGAAIDRRGDAVAFLLAADFRQGRIDIFGSDFSRMDDVPAFVDAQLPAGLAPFGIQAIGERIYVAYAQRDGQGQPATGPGLGCIDVFDTHGHLLKRLVGPGGPLNAPWGMAQAPADFGAFGNALLVANLGDGRINGFDIETGHFLGALAMPGGRPIAIDGLRGIAFGRAVPGSQAEAATLFYTAGPADGRRGVYGRIDSR